MTATITSSHIELLESAAISIEVAEAAGVRSIEVVDQLPEGMRWAKNVPGLLFPWQTLDSVTVMQYRPDNPIQKKDGDSTKYVFPKGAGSIINIHPAMRDRIGTTSRVVIVEGTKQYLAAISSAPDDTLIVGLGGCWGWSSNNVANPDLAQLVPANASVIVVFDADIATNRNVYNAAKRLKDTLLVIGAAKVSFVQIPAGGTAGLDDFLATMPDRPTAFANLLELAGPLPRKPKAPPEPIDPDSLHPFFDENGLKAEALRTAVRERERLAVDQAGRILVYRHGVYVEGSREVVHVVAELLGDMYRSMHLRSLIEPLEAELHAEGLVIPEVPERAVINVRNGLLDPFTGELTPHTPEHMSMVQFPIDWDPTATCPIFDEWLLEVADDRGDDLLEATSLVLDTRGQRQRKAVFLLGPTRSGKSTYIRCVEAMVGHVARSAVTLHELSSDKFATADLYGKVLNTANELSAAHVDDLSAFKQVTGDDPVRAQHKYGTAFVFHNRALFVFAANELPTVGEVSGAYLARVRPYRFPHSFEGAEDPTLEQRLRLELPGILVRLVEALRRFEQRGGYADDEGSRSALGEFARRSDRVRLFLHETCENDPTGFCTRGELYEAFEEWARQNRRQSLGRHRFLESVETAGYRAVIRTGTRGFVGLIVRPQADWGTPVDPTASQGAEGADQPFSSPMSGSVKEEGEVESKRVVRGEWAEPAPSAPSANGERERIEF